jgi:ankyrin repeat protein
LLQAGSNVNIGNDHGNVPLHYACFWRWSDVAKLLLEFGAYLNAVNLYDKRPTDFANDAFTAMLQSIVQQNQKVVTSTIKTRGWFLNGIVLIV